MANGGGWGAYLPFAEKVPAGPVIVHGDSDRFSTDNTFSLENPSVRLDARGRLLPGEQHDASRNRSKQRCRNQCDSTGDRDA